jgi:hypothetical protein
MENQRTCAYRHLLVSSKCVRDCIDAERSACVAATSARVYICMACVSCTVCMIWTYPSASENVCVRVVLKALSLDQYSTFN